MPHPSWDPTLGRMVHPWEKMTGRWQETDRRYERLTDALWRLHRGNPPRYWDEPYYTTTRPESLFDMLQNDKTFTKEVDND